jgi:hypothetical protein
MRTSVFELAEATLLNISVALEIVSNNAIFDTANVDHNVYIKSL